MTILTRWEALQNELRAALKDTGSLRLQTDLASPASAGDVMVGPPSPLYEGMCSPNEPTGFSYTVYVVEALGARAVERLLGHLPGLLTALGGLGSETEVEPPVPTVFPSGTNDMPAYSIAVETTLAEDDES